MGGCSKNEFVGRGGINIFEQHWVSFNLTHYLLKHYCRALWQSNEVIREDDYERQVYKTPPPPHLSFHSGERAQHSLFSYGSRSYLSEPFQNEELELVLL